jgi:hypothetical protein
VIDEQARQIEHPRHPGDDGDDVEGFEPGVHGLEIPGKCDKLPYRQTFISLNAQQSLLAHPEL